MSRGQCVVPIEFIGGETAGSREQKRETTEQSEKWSSKLNADNDRMKLEDPDCAALLSSSTSSEPIATSNSVSGYDMKQLLYGIVESAVGKPLVPTEKTKDDKQVDYRSDRSMRKIEAEESMTKPIHSSMVIISVVLPMADLEVKDFIGSIISSF